MNDSDAARKAIIYARVASRTVAEPGESIVAQEARCHEYAREKGYTVAGTFADFTSGNSIDRPGMKAMLAFLDKHRAEAHVVLVDDVSRLARDVETHMEVRAAIKSAGGLIECPAFEFGGADKLQKRIAAAATEYVKARQNQLPRTSGIEHDE